MLKPSKIPLHLASNSLLRFLAITLLPLYYAPPIYSQDIASRQWRSRNSEKAIMGAYLDVSESLDSVSIQKSDGKTLDINFKYLHDEDIRYAKQVYFLKSDYQQYAELESDLLSNDFSMLSDAKLMRVRDQYPNSPYASILLGLKNLKEAKAHADHALKAITSQRAVFPDHHAATLNCTLSILAHYARSFDQVGLESQCYDKIFRQVPVDLAKLSVSNVLNFLERERTSLNRMPEATKKRIVAFLDNQQIKQEQYPKFMVPFYKIPLAIDIPTDGAGEYRTLNRNGVRQFPISQQELKRREDYKEFNKRMEISREIARNTFPPQLQGIWYFHDGTQSLLTDFFIEEGKLAWKGDVSDNPKVYAQVVKNTVTQPGKNYTATVENSMVEATPAAYFDGTIATIMIRLNDGQSWTFYRSPHHLGNFYYLIATDSTRDYVNWMLIEVRR
jgi:hypothetical protein